MLFFKTKHIFVAKKTKKYFVISKNVLFDKLRKVAFSKLLSKELKVKYYVETYTLEKWKHIHFVKTII